jgi:autotransporter-associated beta strand protein
MFRTWYRQSINRMNSLGSGRRNTSARGKRGRPPRLEVLEDRRAPATHIWTGAVSGLWSNPSNWSGGAPSTAETNVILDFTSGTAHNPNNTNDIAGLTVQAIEFAGLNYTLGANAITLAGNTTVDVFSNETTFNLGLNLTGSASAHDHVFKVFDSAHFVVVNGRITSSGPNTLDQQGPGQLELANSTNSYGGSTLINQGTLVLLANNAVPASSAVTVNAGAAFDMLGLSDTIGSLAGAGNVAALGALGTGADKTSTTFSGVISGTGSVSKIGTGTWTLAGANIYSGPTQIFDGTLKLGINDAIPQKSLLHLNAAAAKFDANNFFDNIGGLAGASGSSVTLDNTGGLGIGSLSLSTTFAGTISGGGSIFLNGGTLSLANHNTYQGFTSIAIGTTLSVDAEDAIPSTSRVVLGGTLDMTNVAGFNDTIGSLEGSGQVKLGTGELITGGNNLSTDYSGIVSGPGIIVKEGSGAMTLSAFNTNSFRTDAAGGTLLVNGFEPNSIVLVGATLGGFGTTGTILVTTNGTVSPGSSTSTGILSSAFSLGYTTTPATLRIRLNGLAPGSGFDQFKATGAVDLDNTTLNASLGFTAAIGDTFPIVVASGGVTGLFKDQAGNVLHNGQGLTIGGARFQINYNATSVVLTRVPGPATQYLVSARHRTEAGLPFDVTVTALDPDGNIVNTYAGTVHFTSTDPQAQLPDDYTFTQDDNGVHTFAGGATLFSGGPQAIFVTDAITGIQGRVKMRVLPTSTSSLVSMVPASVSSGSPVDTTEGVGLSRLGAAATVPVLLDSDGTMAHAAPALVSTLAAPASPPATGLGQPLDQDLAWLGGASALALDGLGVG